MQAGGSICCWPGVAYCTGIPLLLDAPLVISIQLLIMEILGMLIEFFLTCSACFFLVEFGLTCKVVRWGAPLSCAFHPLLPIHLAAVCFGNYFHIELAFIKNPDVA